VPGIDGRMILSFRTCKHSNVSEIAYQELDKKWGFGYSFTRRPYMRHEFGDRYYPCFQQAYIFLRAGVNILFPSLCNSGVDFYMHNNVSCQCCTIR